MKYQVIARRNYLGKLLSYSKVNSNHLYTLLLMSLCTFIAIHTKLWHPSNWWNRISIIPVTGNFITCLRWTARILIRIIKFQLIAYILRKIKLYSTVCVCMHVCQIHKKAVSEICMYGCMHVYRYVCICMHVYPCHKSVYHYDYYFRWQNGIQRLFQR